MIDYRNPDYGEVLAKRAERLEIVKADPELLENLKKHYATHWWDFVRDWGFTFEPRNVELGLIANIPFIPWDRQVDYMKWVYARWQAQERGLAEKSRDCGVTWLSVGCAVAGFLFVEGIVFGFGSRKEDLVDKRGDSKSIFEKLRHFIDNVPSVFMPAGWDERTCMSHMKITNPENGAEITGEVGDNIGRGGRASIYFVDEAAFLERQKTVDKALSQTTNCQIDISTPNGSGNEFYKKQLRFHGTERKFVFDWKDDPRKDEAWLQKQYDEQDEVTVAQEILRDYNASQEDSFIPAKWVEAAVDAHKKLGFEPTGLRVCGFDPADVGDAKALVSRWGSVILEADQMTNGDITVAVPWAFNEADKFRADIFRFDGDGMGAPVIKTALSHGSGGRFKVAAYHGGGGVEDPEKLYGSDEKKDENLKTNQDTFLNYRAQTWTWARDRFKATYDAIQRANQGMIVNADPEDLISISSECACLLDLQSELSRPMRIWSNNGKIQVESKKHMKAREVQSPNLADALVIAMATKRPPAKKKRVTVTSRAMLDPAVGY